MLKAVILREIQNHLFNLRFQIGILVVVSAFAIGTISSLKGQEHRMLQYTDFESQFRENMREQAESNVGRLAVDKRIYLMKPRQNSFIADCKETYLPNVIEFSAWEVSTFMNKRGSANPFLNKFQEMNWTFIVTVIMGFLVLLFTFDSVSGEKEAGTLSLTLSNPLSRGTVLFGKWVATVLTTMIMLVLGILISMLVVTISGQTVLTAGLILEIVGFILFAFIFFLNMAAIGLLASVMTRSANVSLLICLSAWLLFAVIIPNSATFAAKRFFSIVSSQAVDERVDQAYDDLNNNAPEGSWSYRGSDPFYPRHELRADLMMKRMEARQRILKPHIQEMFRQFERTRMATVASPICLFEYLSESAVGGGYTRFRKTWDDMHLYQARLLQYFKDLDAADDDSPHWYNPVEDISTTRKPVPFSSVPLFQETAPDISNRIDAALIYVLVCVLYTVILFALSFVVFIRYDVR
ncbi:ABC transporter permease [bacterium]|nr:ABC transporter permease [bacterium]